VRPEREALMKAARRREIDAVLVWRLDRWGRSLPDLVVSLKELTELGVGFLSLNEALDLTTPHRTCHGGAAGGLRRVRARHLKGKSQGRHRPVPGQGQAPRATGDDEDPTAEGAQLFAQGSSKSQISRELGISRSSVRALLEEPTATTVGNQS
jgi:DNA invertase Pin-like site-specific DNA recombinase